MSDTTADLERFHSFARTMLSNGGAASLEDCLVRWRLKEETAATVAAVRQAVAEADAGLGIPLDEVEAELRREFGLQPRQPN